MTWRTSCGCCVQAEHANSRVWYGSIQGCPGILCVVSYNQPGAQYEAVGERCLCNEHHMFGLSTSESVILAVYSCHNVISATALYDKYNWGH